MEEEAQRDDGDGEDEAEVLEDEVGLGALAQAAQGVVVLAAGADVDVGDLLAPAVEDLVRVPLVPRVVVRVCAAGHRFQGDG